MIDENKWFVERVSAEEFKKVTAYEIKNIFNTEEFNEFNAGKVDEVFYLLIKKEHSVRFSLILGRKKDLAKCPFSAPFGYPEQIKSNQTVEDFMCCTTALESYMKEINISSVTIVFPPSFYNYSVIETWINVLHLHGWKPEIIDLNFAMHLSELKNDYDKKMLRNGRKNLRIALGSNLSLLHCDSIDQKKLAYEIIKRNRESKGFPLMMTEEQVLKTMDIVPSDMYVVKTNRNEYIASALIYKVTSKIAEVIYWGEIPGFSEKKSINFLSYELMQRYLDLGFEYLDIGPGSDEKRYPNFGLCNFKDSIACERRIKVYMRKEFLYA